ncbi:MAG: alpha/beta hydrolase [Ignavibacteria bacterium]|nr:alpha/beta hydrolase [Ignavibacteria bacterium]
MKQYKIFVLFFSFCQGTFLYAQQIKTQEYIYSQKGNIELKAYLFSKDSIDNKTDLPAIVIFHGGGWAYGDASWSFGRAKHFANLGFVSVAAQYRLSDQKEITPLEAMEDAKEIIKWMRTNSSLLKIDPNKIVGYGWSAGAHLVVSAALFADSNSSTYSSPNALILVSPAVSLEKDNWFRQLLLNRIEVSKVSPDKNIKKGLPPTLILQGREDTVTPLVGVQNFANQMKANGNICELIIYDNVGHLFTPSSEPDSGFPNPDKKIQSMTYEKADEFLRSLGYINK